MNQCKICGSPDSSQAYLGPIRIGKFGNLSPEPVPVYRCNGCGAETLKTALLPAGYYESEQYRNEYDASNAEAEFYRVHDQDQLLNLDVTGTAIFRGKRVADIGCGAGSFLDYVKGAASETIAIEPNSAYQEALRRKGHRTFPYVKDVLKIRPETVDVAVSFSVLEHMEDPLEFLKEIRGLLTPGGTLILSTPNRNDILFQMLPENFPSFFYRKVHLWYFEQKSLTRLLELAGFRDVNIEHRHRFGMGNFLGWLKNQRPQGNIRFDFQSKALDELWAAELERQGLSDYLYAFAKA